MYYELEQSLRASVSAHLERVYAWNPPLLVVDAPPKPEMGDFALPVCFELAKQLRKPPRGLAQEIASQLQLPPGFSRIEVAGGGYLNVFVDRAAAVRATTAGPERLPSRLSGKVIVEHTNINPNKAAHIGHLRNAVLGDTWVRLLRRRGEQVEVQNLQDNTGVQVADVVAAFLHLEAAGNPAQARTQVVTAIQCQDRPFDYVCWDLYAAISQHYEQHPEDVAAWRPGTLHAIEAGNNPVAELAELISTAIAHCHLKTMERLGIRYDVLPRESEILQLHLWETAFEQLKGRGAIRKETAGKNSGCWVMDRATLSAEGEEESKVIVRSNNTVTYVGKDIAYQMWKFGLLPLEFGFAPFHRYRDGGQAWTTARTSPPGAPAFGHGAWVFNVIDTRQSYLQEIVADGLRALDYQEQAARSVHFSYGMVALSAACAAELGYAPENEGERVDVSGRKGTGVKADDLIDRLLQRTRDEVAERHPDTPENEREAMAHAIAVGALRYFLLKFTRNTVIAFDFKEALSFEGETGPYVQYAAVRAGNILNKARAAGETADEPAIENAASFSGDNDTWSLLWLAGRLGAIVEQCLTTQEPAFLAKYAFQLAQAFNNFYHHTPVMQEADAAKRRFLLSVVEFVQRQLVAALGLMGIEAPAAM